MKIFPVIIAAVIFLAVLAFFLMRGSVMPEQGAGPIQVVESTTDVPGIDEGPYLGLRKLALDATAEGLELDLPGDQLRAYGVVIDIATADGSATIAAFQTGDASMYTSFGGGVIGGGRYDSIRKAAIALVRHAESSSSTPEKTDETPLPSAGKVYFYILTNKGRYVVKDSTDNFFTGAGPNHSFSIAANSLLFEIQQIDAVPFE